MTNKRIRSPAVSFTALALGQASMAMAEEPANVWMELDRSNIHLGAYIADFDTTIRLSSGLSGSGTEVDLEGDFGLDDSSTNILFHIDYRFRPRHRVDFAYYDLSRDGSNVIEREIEFGDVTFPVGATIDSKFDYRIGKLTYSYSVFQNRQVDLALAAGLYIADFDYRATNRETGDTEGDNDIIPVPIIGLRGAYMFNPRLIVNGYVEYLTVDNSDTDATYIDTTISIEYRLRGRFGVGLAYNFVNIDGEDKSSDDAADFEYSGLLLFVMYNFR